MSNTRYTEAEISNEEMMNIAITIELWDRVPGSGVTEPAEGALRAKEDGHRGSWLTLSLRT